MSKLVPSRYLLRGSCKGLLTSAEIVDQIFRRS